MSSAENSIYPSPGAPVGFASNGGVKRYLIEAESTTGFVAWRLDDGTTLINQAENVDLPASRSLTFWSCVGCEDATPAGEITSLDCHANELVSLDVRQLKTLRFLDCCYNRLTELDLTGLADLEVLDVTTTAWQRWMFQASAHCGFSTAPTIGWRNWMFRC